MKGTIDVQIKHKDGSIETRHEHNVVFDIPALALKKVVQMPIRGISPQTYPNIGSITAANLFPEFSLCEDTADLTRPKYLPCSLTTTTSGTSSAWYISPMTRITSDKNITAQASWTLGEAMTIKSIRVLGNYKPDNSRPSYIFPVLYDDGIMYMNGFECGYGKKLSFADFKFTNSTSFYRLVPPTEISTSDGVEYINTPLYYPYPLTNDERFAFFDSSDKYISLYASAQLYSTAKIKIFNSSTGDITREFPLSQFSDFPTGAKQRAWVVNTGTKNILCRRSYNSPYTYSCWQIPDTATADPIPTVDITFPSNFVSPQAVLDNYLVYGGETSASIIRLNDDLSVTTYKGRLAGHSSYSTQSNYSLKSYFPTGLTMSYSSVYYPNLTAANFSTPIELAEGDVLTVSYKIEVA